MYIIAIHTTAVVQGHDLAATIASERVECSIVGIGNIKMVMPLNLYMQLLFTPSISQLNSKEINETFELGTYMLARTLTINFVRLCYEDQYLILPNSKGMPSLSSLTF